jgi:hypothetical protein
MAIRPLPHYGATTPGSSGQQREMGPEPVPQTHRLPCVLAAPLLAALSAIPWLLIIFLAVLIWNAFVGG